MTVPGLLTFALIVNALVFCVIPLLSRRGIFFAVTVPQDFRKQAPARATLLRYRTIVLVGSAAALVMVQVASVSVPRAAVLAVVIQSLVGTAAWVWAHRTIQPYAVASSAVRVASLAPRDTSYPGGAIAIASPFLILGAAAFFLYANWDVIPDAIPTHWNASGEPDRWRTKTVRSVFGTLAFGAALVSAMQIQTWFVLRRTRQIAATGVAADAEWQFKRRTATYSVLSSFIVTVMVSYFATRGVVAVDGNLGWGIWLVLGVIIVFSLGFTAWMMFAGQGGQRRVPIDEGAPVLGDASPDRAWKAGIFYFNPDDPAIFVEKRMGLGWTMNFGNKWAWLFMFAALGVPFLVMLLMRS